MSSSAALRHLLLGRELSAHTVALAKRSLLGIAQPHVSDSVAVHTPLIRAQPALPSAAAAASLAPLPLSSGARSSNSNIFNRSTHTSANTNLPPPPASAAPTVAALSELYHLARRRLGEGGSLRLDASLARGFAVAVARAEMRESPLSSSLTRTLAEEQSGASPVVSAAQILLDMSAATASSEAVSTATATATATTAALHTEIAARTHILHERTQHARQLAQRVAVAEAAAGGGSGGSTHSHGSLGNSNAHAHGMLASARYAAAHAALPMLSDADALLCRLESLNTARDSLAAKPTSSRSAFTPPDPGSPVTSSTPPLGSSIKSSIAAPFIVDPHLFVRALAVLSASPSAMIGAAPAAVARLRLAAAAASTVSNVSTGAATDSLSSASGDGDANAGKRQSAGGVFPTSRQLRDGEWRRTNSWTLRQHINSLVEQAVSIGTAASSSSTLTAATNCMAEYAQSMAHLLPLVDRLCGASAIASSMSSPPPLSSSPPHSPSPSSSLSSSSSSPTLRLTCWLAAADAPHGLIALVDAACRAQRTALTPGTHTSEPSQSAFAPSLPTLASTPANSNGLAASATALHHTALMRTASEAALVFLDKFGHRLLLPFSSVSLLAACLAVAKPAPASSAPPHTSISSDDPFEHILSAAARPQQRRIASARAVASSSIATATGAGTGATSPRGSLPFLLLRPQHQRLDLDLHGCSVALAVPAVRWLMRHCVRGVLAHQRQLRMQQQHATAAANRPAAGNFVRPPLEVMVHVPLAECAPAAAVSPSVAPSPYSWFSIASSDSFGFAGNGLHHSPSLIDPSRAALVAVPVADISHLRFASASAPASMHALSSLPVLPNSAASRAPTFASAAADSAAGNGSIAATAGSSAVRTALAAVHTLRIYTGYGSRHGAVLRAGGGGALDHASALRTALLSELQRVGGESDDGTDGVHDSSGGIGGRKNIAGRAAGFLGAEFARAHVTVELVPHNAGAFDIGLASLCASAGSRELTWQQPRCL